MKNLSFNLNLDETNILQFEGEEKPRHLPLDQIHFELILPSSHSSLKQLNEELKRMPFTKAFFRNRMDKSGFGVRALPQEDQVTIKDFPRTLFSPSEFITGDFRSSYTEEVSKKYHKAFIDKFNELMQQNPNNVILSSFKITIL